MLSEVTIRVVPDDQKTPDKQTPPDVLERLHDGFVIIENGTAWVRRSTYDRIKVKWAGRHENQG